MSLDFSDMVVIVTGSSAGIGADAVRGFSRGGAKVVVNYAHNKEAAENVAADCIKCGGDAIVVGADLSKPEACQNLVTSAIDKWGKLDVVVNNAGTTKFVSHDNLDGLSPEDFEAIYKLNLIAPYEMVKAARPHLAKDGGAIINISSIAGVRAIGSSLAYVASKGALNSMTLGLARSLAKDNIRVNAVCPGFVGTDWFKNVFGEEKYNRIADTQRSLTPSNHFAGPEDICGPILFFAHPMSRHVTGQLMVVDGGMLLGMPFKIGDDT